MDVTKLYKFIGFGAMEVTKLHEFPGFEAMDDTKPYEFPVFGAMSGALIGSPTERQGRRQVCTTYALLEVLTRFPLVSFRGASGDVTQLAARCPCEVIGRL